MHEIEKLIAAGDDAINRNDFDAMMEFYLDDATLVIKPGLEVRGKPALREAFVRIAEFFKYSVHVSQRGMMVIEGADTALVLANTVVVAGAKTDAPFQVERRATYVYRKDAAGRWKCAIDNSYGTDLLATIECSR